VGYKYKGKPLPSFAPESWILDKVVPQYKKVPGWRKSIQKTVDFPSLPQPFKDYIKLIEDTIQARIAVVSTGVERKDTILNEAELKGLINLEKVKKEIN
jgi:adenylosuccinate synthase